MSIRKTFPLAINLTIQLNIEYIKAIMGIKAKAIYLPSSLANGRPKALIPLHTNPSLPLITEALPQRLIVQYDSHPDDIGLLVATIGTTVVIMPESRPGPTPAEFESSLPTLFPGILGVADGSRVVNNENNIRVEIQNPRIENKAT
jgi:hypothetical protein